MMVSLQSCRVADATSTIAVQTVGLFLTQSLYLSSATLVVKMAASSTVVSSLADPVATKTTMTRSNGRKKTKT